MVKLLLSLFLGLVVSGCATAPPPPLAGPDPCANGESSWDCQVERYGKVNQ